MSGSAIPPGPDQRATDDTGGRRRLSPSILWDDVSRARDGRRHRSEVPLTPPPPRARPRDLGVRIGILPPGPTDSIVDVADVRVGHATVWRDEPPPPDGRGVARTGVTAIVPFTPGELFSRRVPAGASVLNGAGEAIGITSIEEWGVLETPILLTSSMAIGRVYDAAIPVLLELGAGADDDEAVMPVVAECDDGWLNAARRVQVDAADVRAAIEGASGPELGPVVGGAVGAGTGMVCYEMKGGIGTASRVVRGADQRSSFGLPGVDESGTAYTLGVLALANFGRLERLTVDGVRVGEALLADGWFGEAARDRERGSCVVVVATDAPLLGSQLERLARRAGLGLARTGSSAGHGSGEIFLAFSTGDRVTRGSGVARRSTEVVDDEYLDPFFGAVVEATEAAVIDALFRADTVEGHDGHIALGLPVDRVMSLLRASGRLAT
jgi:D-aminopeptidase